MASLGVANRNTKTAISAHPAMAIRKGSRMFVVNLQWCPERESNPHALRPGILSPVRLPISSSGQKGGDYLHEY
jgi:hypothetical protein